MSVENKDKNWEPTSREIWDLLVRLVTAFEQIASATEILAKRSITGAPHEEK